MRLACEVDRRHGIKSESQLSRFNQQIPKIGLISKDSCLTLHVQLFWCHIIPDRKEWDGQALASSPQNQWSVAARDFNTATCDKDEGTVGHESRAGPCPSLQQ